MWTATRSLLRLVPMTLGQDKGGKGHIVFVTEEGQVHAPPFLRHWRCQYILYRAVSGRAVAVCLVLHALLCATQPFVQASVMMLAALRNNSTLTTCMYSSIRSDPVVTGSIRSSSHQRTEGWVARLACDDDLTGMRRCGLRRRRSRSEI
jgi:hypothetical protein